MLILEGALRYLAFAVFALLLPGLAVLRLLRLPVDLALVLPAGLACAAGLTWLSLVVGLPALFPCGLFLLVLAALFLGRAGPWTTVGPPLRGALPALLATVALLAVTQYAGNRPGPGGEFLLDPFVAFDTAFHVGLAHELAIGYPPQVPGVSGLPLGYHLGLDLVRSAALRFAGVGPYDQIARFDVTLLALGLVLVLRSAAATLGGTSRAVALAGFIPLATDLSFAFAANPQAHWWADLLRGNLLVSVALANPVVPALALTLAALIALEHGLTAAHPARWLTLAAAFAFATPFFKVFLGAHLLLGLLACAVLRPGARRASLIVGTPAALATAALVLGQGGETVAVSLAPLDLVRMTRETLGLPPLAGLALVGWATLWVFASLGIRVAGLAGAATALRSGPAVGTAIAAMALAAWPLGLLFRVAAPEMLPGQTVVNDAAYLIEQGSPLLSLFAALALARLGATKHRRALVVVACVLLALPSTVQFAVKKARTEPDPIPASALRAMAALQQVTAAGDVVLQRPAARYPPLPVVLAGRRVPYERFTPWLTQFARVAVLQERHERVHRFFRTADPAEAMAIADSLDARVLVLYGPDRVRFPIDLLYEPVHEEAGARVYRRKVPLSR